MPEGVFLKGEDMPASPDGRRVVRSTVKDLRQAAIQSGIPTKAEYDAAGSALSNAQFAVQQLESRLRYLLPLEARDEAFHGDDEDWGTDEWFDAARPYPTAADVGLLWSCIDGLGLSIDALTGELDELKQRLQSLDMERLEAPNRKAKSA